jgi:hypothetical protein
MRGRLIRASGAFPDFDQSSPKMLNRPALRALSPFLLKFNLFD